MKRLWRYLEGQKLWVVFYILVATGNAIAQTGGWLLVRDAIDNGIRAGDKHHSTVVVVIYLCVAALGWLLQGVLIRGLAGLGQRMVVGLRRDLFDHLTGLSLRYFSQQKAGWIIARITSDVDAVSDVLSQGMPTLVANVILLPTAVIALLIADFRLGLVVFAIVPPALVLTRWFQRTSHVALIETRNRIGIVTAQVAESLSGMAVVQAFNREHELPAAVRRAERGQPRGQRLHAEDLLDLLPVDRVPRDARDRCRALHRQRAVDPRDVDDRDSDHGALSAAARVPAAPGTVGRLRPAAIRRRRDGEDRDHPRRGAGDRSRRGAHELPRIEGDLAIDRVVFAYGAEPVLHGVESTCRAGGCLALVGESGGGKSTLARLVGRFYDPDQGEVRVDGVDLREVKLRSYRRQLGVVLQDPFLFSGTIASNIRFAKPDATDAEVEAAARAVGVDRVAARLSGGLDHTVREGGSGLSAGERQLISIARALLADPRILILDEATSNIDRPTEILIEQALDTLLHGRTSIIIAHRLSTVRRADEIVVIEHGRIVQRGTERELLAQDGPFRRLAHDLSAAPPSRQRPGKPRLGPGPVTESSRLRNAPAGLHQIRDGCVTLTSRGLARRGSARPQTPSTRKAASTTSASNWVPADSRRRRTASGWPGACDTAGRSSSRGRHRRRG